VTIPQNAEIISAFIRLTSSSSQSSATLRFGIYLENVDAPAAPVSIADFNGKDVTAKVDWDIASAWSTGVQYDSPDIKTILQTIIDRAGWSSGNAIVALLKDDGGDNTAYRGVRAIEHSAGIYKAELHVVWEA